MLFLPFRTYNTDNKKSEDTKDLMSIESSLYYFVCLVLLLQILQKSIVTLAIIYKFGGYKEKGSKKGRYLKNGTLRIRKYEITTIFNPGTCRNLIFLLRLRQLLIRNARIKDFKIGNKALVSNKNLYIWGEWDWGVYVINVLLLFGSV